MGRVLLAAIEIAPGSLENALLIENQIIASVIPIAGTQVGGADG